jgi:4a-hydroxytetrahydrobiopterin dehydratase
MRATVDTRGKQHDRSSCYKTCTACRGGIPPLTREQPELFHAQAPDWQLAEEAHRIERSFRFRNFRDG